VVLMQALSGYFDFSLSAIIPLMIHTNRSLFIIGRWYNRRIWDHSAKGLTHESGRNVGPFYRRETIQTG